MATVDVANPYGPTQLAAAIGSAQDGDTVLFPQCDVTWTTGSVVVTIDKSITIQGAGAIHATEDGGGGSTTGSDLTKITDNIAGSETPIRLTVGAGRTLRVTGIAFLSNGSSTPHNDGMMIIVAPQTSTVRLDRCHIYTGSRMDTGIAFGGGTLGVVDHNYFEAPSNTTTNDLKINNGDQWDPGSGTIAYNANGPWADDDHWGTNQFLFIEDNRFFNGNPLDGARGARYVFRYNAVVTDGNGGIQGHVVSHGLESNPVRSMRACEIYHNTFTHPSPGCDASAFTNVGGGTLFWGNTISQYLMGVALWYMRSDPDDPTPPPDGWGMCDGVSGTIWDHWYAAGGYYEALDGPARGKGDLLSTADYVVDIRNTRTGTRVWPEQALSPIYIWGNTYTPASGWDPPDQLVTNQLETLIHANREYYLQFGAYGESGSFDGSVGIGQGLDAAKSNYTPTDGVGYWATDTETLYVGSGGSWVEYYTPYQYPYLGGTAPVGIPVLSAR